MVRSLASAASVMPITLHFIKLILIFNVCLKVVLCFYIQNEFITSRYLLNDSQSANEWLHLAPVELPSSTSVNNFKLRLKSFKSDDFMGYNSQTYRLRYKPKLSKARLFWNKFAEQQEQLSTVEPTEAEPITTTESNTGDVPGVDPIPGTEPAPQPATDPPSPTEPQTTEALMTQPNTEESTESLTEPVSTSSPSTTRKTLMTSTTYSTIMQPSKGFPFNLAEKFKNLFTFTQPKRINLIQKYGIPLTNRTRSKGFLSLFEVIKFPNTKCSVNMGDIRSLEGTCYHEFECKSLGGIPSEGCADGVGVCCICKYETLKKLYKFLFLDKCYYFIRKNK